ncbi:MAG: hypothetical protein N2117_11400 [Anaerolineales bacterium]|nr:hypothetical protein [Anaerolineales bacterium]MCX7755832.1 hypothetical protein [Anaerolineales bacterium]MDW8277473.1 hypothetical protein [Anaerolineales bacterium]
MSKFLRVLPLVSLLLAALACNLPETVSPPPAAPPIEIPTFTPTAQVEVKPTEPPAPPTLTPPPTALMPQTRVIDPRALSGCDIFLESDFPNATGTFVASAQPLSDAEKKACLYTFSGTPSTLFAGIFTSLPGREAFENVRQFDAMTGGVIEPVSLGEIAIFKVFAEDNRTILEVVLKGWYIVLDGTGLDRKHLLLLAELLMNGLVSY